jgi:hypothetical protein
MEAIKFPGGYLGIVGSVDECEEKCTRSASCNVFTFNKAARSCYSYERAELVTSADFDSGVRVGHSISNVAVQTPPPASASEQSSSTGLFTMRSNMQASGSGLERVFSAPSIAECEQNCARSPSCKVFTYNKAARSCFVHSR